MTIKKVIICGLGALGLTYANKLKNICELKVLVDEKRLEKFIKNPPIFNDIILGLDYILPSQNFEADLIIITTKSKGLDTAIEYMKNFVGEKTKIMSLINGISSEEKIASVYGKEKVVRSYFIGHSAMSKNDNGRIRYMQDGVGKIVLEPNFDIESFFKKNKIDYEVSDSIEASMWIKLGVNIVLNQLSAIYEMNVGDLRKQEDFLSIAKSLLCEVKQVANAYGVFGLENYEQRVLDETYLIASDGKTSMLQDILAKKKTEVDIFSGEIVRLGRIYGIATPHNEEIYNKIKTKEEGF